MDVLRLRFARMIARVVRWAMVNAPGTDEGSYPVQGVTYLGKEADSLTWFPYGYTALAPRGSLSLMWAIAGDSGSLAHMPGSPRERPKMKEGEVAMYHPATGAIVHLMEDGTIDILSQKNILMQSEDTMNLVAIGSAAINCGIGLLLTAPNISLNGNAIMSDNLDHDGTNAGFFGTTPITKPVVSGLKQGGAALNSLIAQLAALGLITDSTS